MQTVQKILSSKKKKRTILKKKTCTEFPSEVMGLRKTSLAFIPFENRQQG